MIFFVIKKWLFRQAADGVMPNTTIVYCGSVRQWNRGIGHRDGKRIKEGSIVFQECVN